MGEALVEGIAAHPVNIENSAAAKHAVKFHRIV